jgi:hypothetical protein
VKHVTLDMLYAGDGRHVGLDMQAGTYGDVGAVEYLIFGVAVLGAVLESVSPLAAILGGGEGLDVGYGAGELDMGPQVEAVCVGTEIVDIFGKRDVVWGGQGKAMVGEGGELLGRDELSVLVGAVLKGASNVRFTGGG